MNARYEKLRREILDKKADRTEIQSLPYLTRVVEESLRLLSQQMNEVRRE